MEGAERAQALLASVGSAEAGPAECWGGGRAALAVSRKPWEMGSDFSGPVTILREGGCAVAADASIYYREDLRRQLESQGAELSGETASHLILAAYRAWGQQCPRYLEGDFAFILWDEERATLLCARDFIGRRPLHFAELGASVLLASTVAGILADSRCSDELNLANVGATAAGLLWSAGSDTAYRAVHVLPPGCTLRWSQKEGAVVEPYWSPPSPGGSPALPFEEAAQALREVLIRATLERMPMDGATVWMSGGRDSTAVFAAGREGLRRAGDDRALVPVSISYPEGDPGREDELIQAVAERWCSSVHWLDIGDIPLFDELADRSAAADEPPAHMYELWNRSLAAGTRACGARVAFDGSGGDQLFQVSDIYLADLLARGRWLQLARELRSKAYRGRRHLFGSTLQPFMPALLRPLAMRLVGESLGRHYMEKPMPPWIRADFAARHALVERDRRWFPVANGLSRADAETRLMIAAPVWAWGASYMTRVLLECGVEARSPLLDGRIVEFAISRPVDERAWGAETKRLLRRSMQGLVPDPVLAPRQFRTGATIGYSRRQAAKHYPDLFERAFGSDSLLAQLGVVDVPALRAALKCFRRDDAVRVALFHTLKTEFWLRGRLRQTAAPVSRTQVIWP